MPNETKANNKIKRHKRGTFKSAAEIEEALRRNEIEQMRILFQKRPQDFKRVYLEMETVSQS